MTIFEKVKSMSVMEFAAFLFDEQNNDVMSSGCCMCKHCSMMGTQCTSDCDADCIKAVAEWLESEVKDA